uniref:Uncharacterized protein n=1 Tax=Romanomermis culicivorax TaxID=13658 RepID=A0A915KBM1_ROMCU
MTKENRVISKCTDPLLSRWHTFDGYTSVESRYLPRAEYARHDKNISNKDRIVVFEFTKRKLFVVLAFSKGGRENANPPFKRRKLVKSADDGRFPEKKSASAVRIYLSVTYPAVRNTQLNPSFRCIL